MPRDEEPCVWANEVIRQTNPRRVNGRKIIERFPQVAGNMRYGRNWAKVVDLAGDVVNARLTGAGSLFDMDDPSARQIRRKFAALGMFELRRCPVALLVSGEMGREQLDESLWKEQPCEPGSYSEGKPCPHALREIELRKKMHRIDMAGRVSKLAAEEDAREIAKNEREELVRGIGDAMRDAMQGLLAAATGTPPPTAPTTPPDSKAKK